MGLSGFIGRDVKNWDGVAHDVPPPTLKANQNVLSLQEEITTTENQISFSRQHYNASVLDYNNAIQVFPNNLLAGMFGFLKREFFEAEPEAAAVPNVDLSLT